MPRSIFPPVGFSLFCSFFPLPPLPRQDDNRDIARSLLLPWLDSPLLRLARRAVTRERPLSHLPQTRSWIYRPFYAKERILPPRLTGHVSPPSDRDPLSLLSNSIPFCLDYFLSPSRRFVPLSAKAVGREIGAAKQESVKLQEERHELRSCFAHRI